MAVLGEHNSKFANRITELRAVLPPIRMSYFGDVQEWVYEYNETETGHGLSRSRLVRS